MHPLPRAGLAAAAISLALAAAAAALLAEPHAPRAASTAHAQPPDAGKATQIPANGRPIVLEVGTGTLIRLPRPAGTVFVANPEIADVQVKSPELVYISAKSPGQTVIYAVDANDRVLLNAPVHVELALSQLRQSLKQVVPGSAISVTQVDSSLVLSGTVADAGQAEKARTMAAAIAGAVKGGQVINRLSVATPNQVNLHVRIAEVSLAVLKSIGVNWHKFGSTIKFNTTNPTTIPNGPVPNTAIFGSLMGEAVSATLDALETEGFVTDLAQPNLTAMSGQTASFLAGGEFPVPVAIASAAGTTAPTISIEFKTFGVQLAFTPTIIDANHLNLKIRPEVSCSNWSRAAGSRRSGRP